jgi:hypothetical protein
MKPHQEYPVGLARLGEVYRRGDHSGQVVKEILGAQAAALREGVSGGFAVHDSSWLSVLVFIFLFVLRFFFFFFVCVCVLLGFELGASRLLYHLSNFPSPLCFSIFRIGL